MASTIKNISSDATLRYSPLYHPEYATLAKIFDSDLNNVQFVELHYDPAHYKEFGLELVLSKDGAKIFRDPIIVYLQIMRILFPQYKDNIFSPTTIQWIEFAYNSLIPELACLSSTSSLVNNSLAFLHEQLANRQFLTPSLNDKDGCGAGDYLIYCLLQGRMRNIISSVAQKYFRVVRWWNGVNALVLSGTLNPFVPMTSLMTPSIDTLTTQNSSVRLEVNDNKKKEKTKKSKEESATPKEPKQLVVDPFYRVDIRVGRIIDVKKHPEADRLFIEQVDIGRTEGPITVVSGLVGLVPQEVLLNRLCLFVVNLKPASLCKVKSEGMILVSKAIKTEGDTQKEVLQPLIVPPECRPGMRLLLEDVDLSKEISPDSVLSSKENVWGAVVQPQLRCVDGELIYNCNDVNGKDCKKIKAMIDGRWTVTSDEVPNGIIS